MFSSLRGQGKNKKIKTQHLSPILFGRLRTSLGTSKGSTIRILLDSGASRTIIYKPLVKRLRLKRDDATTWATVAGSFQTNETCKIQFSLPELWDTRIVEWTAHVTNQKSNYDMIIGRDVLTELGINLNFKDMTMQWDTAVIPMKPIDATIENSYAIEDSVAMNDATERIKKILDAKYEPANIDEVVAECTHLDESKRNKLKTLLNKYKELFDGSLGHWKGQNYDIELREDAKPYHARPYPIPKAYEKTLRMEVERLCKVGVLKKVNHSEWAAPTFIIPKKDGSVRFISDFRELNKRIKRKPYPIPKIQDLLLKLEGFKYATSLDLNMGYYHIELSPASKRLCTIVLPFGKYEYQRLPMGLCNSPDIFQEKMSELMEGLEYVRAYIDDVLALTTGSWDDHLEKLEEVLKRLADAGLKVNAKKSFFGKPELEYLGYWVTRDGVQPVPKKVEAIHNIAPPTNKKELRGFIGMVNYYRDMWIRRSDTLAPLTALTSKEAKWRWTEVEQKAFDTMKRIVSRETLLAYPNFSEPFEIHTDASHTQLGAVISQRGKPIAFYSRKLNPAQTRYTTTERELLAIVETLKEFRNILLGQQIRVYTDHKNLTYQTFNTERVMRWRLILEEYGPELIYIKGENNVVADALSRLNLQPTTLPATLETMAEHFGLDDDDLPADAYPLHYKLIAREQNKDRNLFKLLKSNTSGYTIKSFCGGGKKRDLICHNDKIVIPSSLQRRVVEWYHTTLCHPGETRTEQTIRQHFTWTRLRQDVAHVCGRCHTCQVTKKSKKKYGHLPAKEAEVEPWDKLCVDLIGPYTIKRAGKKTLTLWCVTMIDPATGWFEMREIPSKDAATVANIVEMAWLTRYPWPTQITFDRGTEFMAEFARMVKNDYGIKTKPITTRNPQANSIIERVHQTIGNMIRTFRVHDTDIDESDPWSGILSATMFATRATLHTTLQATPSQLVFGRDAILNVRHEANWKFIRDRKQKLIHENNRKENAKRIPHTYCVGEKVLYRADPFSKFGGDAYEGPYEIVQVNGNGTVRMKKGSVTDTVNIRNIHPYRG